MCSARDLLDDESPVRRASRCWRPAAVTSRSSASARSRRASPRCDCWPPTSAGASTASCDAWRPRCCRRTLRPPVTPTTVLALSDDHDVPPAPARRTSVRFSELDGARVGVWGAGREISSFADQLARRLPAARIVLAAFDEPPPADVLATLGAPDARVVVGAEVSDALAGCEVVVRSPGVSIHRPELQALRERGTPVTTATALWLAERQGRRVIGVTGTKGKSTTAALACHLALAAGERAHLAGNIGRPALDLLDTDPREPAVVELSSYHDRRPRRRAGGGRHHQPLPRAPRLAPLRAELPRGQAADPRPGRRAQRSSARPPAGPRAGPDRRRAPAVRPASTAGTRRLAGSRCGGRLRVPTAELPLPGEHNALNLCAALTALEAARDRRCRALPGALQGFQALEHRLQTVAEEHGVTWVDDSISTTPESTLAALASFPGRPSAAARRRPGPGTGLRASLGVRSPVAGATVIGLPSTGSRLLGSRADGRPDRRAGDRGAGPRGCGGARARNGRARAPSCCSRPPLPATTTIATSRSEASAFARSPACAPAIDGAGAAAPVGERRRRHAPMLLAPLSALRAERVRRYSFARFRHRFLRRRVGLTDRFPHRADSSERITT